MNTDKAFAEKIASEYAPQETRKVVALRKLDLITEHTLANGHDGQ